MKKLVCMCFLHRLSAGQGYQICYKYGMLISTLLWQ